MSEYAVYVIVTVKADSRDDAEAKAWEALADPDSEGYRNAYVLKTEAST